MAEKKSFKPIPPTMRGKKRYIKFRLICEGKIAERDVRGAIWGVFGQIFGDHGIAGQRLWMANWDFEKNIGILRCSLGPIEEVKAGLLFVRQAGGKEVIPVILGVSGTIKSLKG
ncbi:MAG: hypothetical protein NUV67_02610 [archaeon]|nr:hypothetical protein [archaeon]